MLPVIEITKTKSTQFIALILFSLCAATFLNCSSATDGELGQACFEGNKCFTGLICQNDVCACEGESDEELCTQANASCGDLKLTDRCEQQRTIECGDCPLPQTCGGDDQPNVCGCKSPTDEQICTTQAANCGSVEETDSCGIQRDVACGTCTLPETCGGSGEENQCGCTSVDDAELCTRENMNCGRKTVVDNCGAMQIIECGTCTLPESCGGNGEENQCGCAAETDMAFCQSNGVDCGVYSGIDNCMQQRSNVTCGSCSEGICGGGGKNRCGDSFALINPGSYRRGSPENEIGRDPDESPAHIVSISQAVWVSKTEVTNLQWAQMMMTAPSSFTGCGESCPVDSVNWWEAVSYLNALSASEGLPPCYELQGCNQLSPGENMICSNAVFQGLTCLGYRLPTEGEWEFIARAGTTTSLPNGPLNGFSCATPDPGLDAIGWYCGNAEVSYSPCWNSKNDITGSSTCAGTHPVRGKLPNDWGVYDMIGNLWEWTNDWYGGYPASSVLNPTGPNQGTTKVVRGCAWSNGARFCRVASRNYYSTDYRFLNVGFRAVRSYSE